MKNFFTLIELIVVIAIIAVLASIIAPNAFRAIEKAKISKTVADMKAVKAASSAYYADVGRWPWNGAVYPPVGEWVPNRGLGFVTNDGAVGWDGPYLEKWPTASWSGKNMEFLYFYYLSDWDGDGDLVSHFMSIRTPPGGDSSALPMPVMQKIDEILDDGNLSTGKIQLYGGFYFDYCVVR